VFIAVCVYPALGTQGYKPLLQTCEERGEERVTIIKQNVRGEHAQVKGFGRLRFCRGEWHDRHPRGKVRRYGFGRFQNRPVSIQAASGEVLADDQKVNVALSSGIASRPGTEQDDAHQLLSPPGLQQAQEALQVTFDDFGYHAQPSPVVRPYTSTSLLAVSRISCRRLSGASTSALAPHCRTHQPTSRGSLTSI
jgi:hypothetical protein